MSFTIKSTYQELFDALKKMAQSYEVESMMDGFTPDLVNILMNNHLQKVKEADRYDRCLKMMNEALANQQMLPVSLQYVLDEADRDQLYHIWCIWRAKLLQEQEEAYRRVYGNSVPQAQSNH